MHCSLDTYITHDINHSFEYDYKQEGSIDGAALPLSSKIIRLKRISQSFSIRLKISGQKKIKLYHFYPPSPPYCRDTSLSSTPREARLEKW